MSRPRQVSDEQILEAARSCFLAEGPSVSTSVIASRLGVSQAALFKRFGTKDELMKAALAPPSLTPWMAQVRAGPSDAPIVEQLTVLALDLSELFAVMVPRMVVLRASGHGHHQQPPGPGVRSTLHPPLQTRMALAHWIALAQDQGRVRALDPQMFAMTLVGALLSRAFTEHMLARLPDSGIPTMDPDRYVRGLIDTLWNGAAPTEAP